MNGGSDINITKGVYIPDEIIVDILSYLPSSSVLRFKIVCKTWYSLISDPLFINLHSKRASQTPKILVSAIDCQLYLLDYERPSFDDSCVSRPIKFPGETCLNYAKIVGSSCGLVCVITDFYGDEFCIWNPLTGECRKIVADLSNQVTDMYKYAYYFHGFGYDSVANDFKLFISLDRWTCNIFSLKANSWKRINREYEYAMMPSDPRAIVLNGIFYWLNSGGSAPFVLAFDVAKETFEKLQLPQQHLPRKYYSVMSLLEHRGSLCVSFSKCGLSDYKNIWMMKEYGVWVHLVSIQNSLLHSCCRIPVLCLSTRNELVFHTERNFTRCGGKEDKLDEICVQQDVYGAVLYAETLVSPNNEDDLQVPIKQYRFRSVYINQYLVSLLLC